MARAGDVVEHLLPGTRIVFLKTAGETNGELLELDFFMRGGGRVPAEHIHPNQEVPWERRYDTARLTPVRVHRVVSALLAHLGTPAKPPNPCGRSPGRPKGRISGQAKRYPAVKKAA